MLVSGGVDGANPESRMQMKKRCDAIEQFMEMVFDIPFILVGFLIFLLAPWRWHTFLGELKLGDAQFSNRADVAKERRVSTLVQMGSVIVDYLAIISATLVLLAPWRSRFLLVSLNLMRDQPAKRQADSAEERHELAFKEFGQLCLDLPCIAMGGVVLITVWRSWLLLADVRLTDSNIPAAVRREACLRHFLLLLRDTPFFLLFGLITATLYRLPNVILKLIASQKRLLASPPLIALDSAEVLCNDKGRVVLTLSARKPAELQAAQVGLAAGGGEFWSSLEATFGNMASVGRSMLPMKLVPKYLPAGSLEQGQTQATLTITGPEGVAKQLQKLASASNPIFTIQGQVGSPPAVLFELNTRASELVMAGPDGTWQDVTST